MGKTQLFRNTYLFAGLVIITFLLIAFTNLHILTPEFYERSGEPGLGAKSDDTVLLQHLQSNIYLWTALYLTVKIGCIVFVLSIAAFLFRLRISIGNLVSAVLIAEYIFVISAIVKICWFLYRYPEGTLQDWHNCYPLSVLAVFSGVPAAWVYPLQTLNIFEVLYWFVLAEGVRRHTDLNFDRSLQIVLKSYVPALACWITIIVSGTLSFFPQSA